MSALPNLTGGELEAAVRLMRAQTGGAGAAAPSLWLMVQRREAGAGDATLAGLRGAARSARAEAPSVALGCLELCGAACDQLKVTFQADIAYKCPQN